MFERYPLLVAYLKTARRILIWAFGLHLLYTILLVFMPVPFTLTMVGRWLGGTSIDKEWVSSSEMSPKIKMAVIASEDQLFNEHYGFDVEEIEKAMKYNKTHKKSKHGASTISQQVAKNVFLWQGRTWFRKGAEVYCTLLIETLWSKERILEVYLNVAEMGDGIFGVEAAAQQYFRKSAKNLTTDEAARIAAILPNPIKYSINGSYAQKRKNWIIRQMNAMEWSEKETK